MLTIKDLKAQGLTLSKNEATELLPFITNVSHRGGDADVIYPGEKAASAGGSGAGDEDQSGSSEKKLTAKQAAIVEYTELFGEAPADSATTKDILKLIEDKKAASAGGSGD